MDFDLKIGAVFSLADNEDGDDSVQGPGNDISGRDDLLEDSSAYLLPDRDDNDEIDIMSSIYEDTSPSTSISVPLTDHLSYTVEEGSHKSDTSHNESTSIVEDPDAPPSLLLENHGSPELRPPSLISSWDSMSPPILQPEEPMKRAVSPEKKKSCTKIAPCYIVLTKIDQCMQGKSSVSSRTFKRSFVECSNMCKKVLFKRRLKAGKDVFNVKTPSKQKVYLVYLLQVEQERRRRSKKSLQCPQIRDIIEKHDLKVEARKKAVGKPAHPRVRRTIFRLPKDFANRPISPIILPTVEEMDENKRDLSTEELARLQDDFVKRKHKIELDALKRLISIKRSLNQNLKRTKRNRAEGYETFLKSDVTSSVSGRVRKVNPRYSGDFAVSRKEIEEQRLVDVAHAQLKRAESAIRKKVEANKKRVEDINKSNDFLQKKRKSFQDATAAEKTAMGKKVKVADVVIDNPEEDNVRSFQERLNKSKKQLSRKTPKPNTLKVLLNSPPINGNKVITSQKTKKLKQKKIQTESRDGVLIQDMPKAENVISGFLQNVSYDENTASPSLQAESESLQNDQYMRAKQLLKDSLDKRASRGRQLKISQILSTKLEARDDNVSSTQQSNDQERYKMLRIPDSGKKLFANREIKEEPVDDGYETNSTCSSASHAVNSSKVVTVAYSNGIYKKVLVNLTSSGQTQPTQATQQTRVGMTSGPILVNTQQGLRYLVPKTALSKHTLPSYSDAIKAKFIPVKSDGTSITAMASLSSVALNTTSSVGNISSTIQQAKSIQTIPMCSQPIPNQQTVQQKVISVLPTVLQVPMQNTMNTSTTSSLLRPTLASPTVVVNQSYVNKTFQQTASGINPPASANVKQTHTVVHKVSPVMQRQTVPNQSERINDSTIYQQPVPVANTSGPGVMQAAAQNQKNVDKCKFYLLKIDGKNVLIPIEGDQAQPKAYVVNSDVITANTQTQNLNSSSNIASPTGIRPTLIGAQSACGNAQAKPTLAVVPNMKQVNTILPTQFTFVPSTTNSSQNKSLLQTVTLTNIAASVAGAGKTGAISGGNNAFASSSATTSVKSTQAYTVISEGNNAIASSSVTTSMKSTQAYTSVVRSGNHKPVSNQSSLQPRSIQPNSSSVSVFPVYLKAAETSTVANSLQSTINNGNTKSAFSVVKSPLYVQPIAGIDSKNQPKGIVGDIYVKNMTPNAKLPIPPLSQNKTSNKQVKEYDGENLDTSDEHGSGELCEKSGVFIPEEVEEEKVEEKPQAFKEAVTAREERLRRLKELLKEKQKAVEDIRSNKP